MVMMAVVLYGTGNNSRIPYRGKGVKGGRKGNNARKRNLIRATHIRT